MTAAPMLSIVATLYRSEAYIEEFIARVSVCARETGLPYEIVLVNDGCPANHWRLPGKRWPTFPI